MANQGPFDPQEESRRRFERRAGGPSFKLTGTPVRLALTAVAIGLGALIILLVVQSSEGPEEGAVVVPTSQATPDTSAPIVTFTPGATSTVPPGDVPPTTTAAPDTTQPGVVAVNGPASVGNTDGGGANMRSGPGVENQAVRLLPDGEPVTVLEGPTAGGDLQWWRVRLADGTEGWVAQDYLVAP